MTKLSANTWRYILVVLVVLIVALVSGYSIQKIQSPVVKVERGIDYFRLAKEGEAKVFLLENNYTPIDWQFSETSAVENNSTLESQKLTIGVLLPNTPSNDGAWQLLKEGMDSIATQMGINLIYRFSDGYSHIAQHRQQFIELVEQEQVDAMILGTIHYRAMDDLVELYGKQDCDVGNTMGRELNNAKVPIVAVVNDIYSPVICAKVMVDYYQVGFSLGKQVMAEAQSKRQEQVVAAFFPGPINSAWAPATLYGFVDAFREFKGRFSLVEPEWGTPQADVQRELIEKVLSSTAVVDYIVGNAVAASEAANLVKVMGLEAQIGVYSTYYSDTLIDQMRTQAISGVLSDQPKLLGQLALRTALEYLQNPAADLPDLVSPSIVVCDANNLCLPK